MKITFTVPGDPQGKERPRVNRYTGAVYTPARTEIYEKTVRQAYMAATIGTPGFENSPVCIDITAYYRMPMNITRARRAAMLNGDELPTKVPDCDNVLKAVCDALNEFAYRDDAQIVHATVKKRWAEVSRVEVTLYDVREASK